MAKDPWHKGRLGKIKNSPAAKKLGGIKDTVNNTLFPEINGPAETRTDHFNKGMQTEMTVLESDIPKAQDIVNTHFEKGVAPQPFNSGNVSSIMNAFDIRARKAPPEGY